jgi:pyrroline-5-carboxylate reductase
MSDWPASLLFVGCGNMGGAMLAGWLSGGIDPAHFTVVDPQLTEVPAGVSLLRELPPGPFDVVLLGIKPQLLDQIAPALAPLAGPETMLLSILAGVELESLDARFPQAGGLVRVVPNLAAAIGKSPVALISRGLDTAKKESVAALMTPLGAPEWLDDETQFDLVTALIGSGPAFVYRFIDALAQGASALGLTSDQAGRLAVAMAEGAGALAAASPHSPAELACRVASPGGMTQVGLDVLDADSAFAQMVKAALGSAAARSAEMARAAR